MSNKKKNDPNTWAATLKKVLPVLIVIAVVLIGYRLAGKNGGSGDDLSIYQPEENVTAMTTERPSEADVPTTEEEEEDSPLVIDFSDSVSADEPYIYELSGDDDTDPDDEISPEAVVTAESSYDYYLTFYNSKLLNQHYEKHGREMGFANAADYEKAANEVILNDDVLYKTERDDGDTAYYLEETNEFVVVSVSGYIRTYFLPNDGIDYFNRQ